MGQAFESLRARQIYKGPAAAGPCIHGSRASYAYCVYTQVAYNATMKAVFVELPAFQRNRADYLDDAAFARLQQALMKNPEAGEVIEGTGGLTAQGIEGESQGGTGNEEIDMKAMMKSKPAPKRDLFAELSEGMTALAEARQGKRTLRTHTVEFKPAPEVTARELVRVRQHLKLSRALFAGYLRTNVRTLENWEQGRAKPNAQAALLINLVKRFPDTVERLAAI